MTRSARAGAIALATLVLVAGASQARNAAASGTANDPAKRGAGAVDAERVKHADDEPGNWLVHGRTWDEQRFSPLREIHTGNVARLAPAWSALTGTRRGLEATPIVVDGVMYATGTWSVVYALDAKTGQEIWRHDPEVPRAKGRDACCDVVNRGVAVWRGRVYVGTIDGRLVALDARTGKRVWEVQTTDPKLPYTITGAPRVVTGLVVIGNGGAEFGVRGYFTAYDAATGKQVWRFYTVPAHKDGPHEHDELARAAATWPADSLWESGLGGTVWDAMAYDPVLDLLYVGVGNSSVYNREVRSPGGGDNLYLASILAVRPSTGEMIWHYQTTPGEQWDYTATQHMILADVRIDGRLRKVLMQAPKNGFFYVLDRVTGDLLSADAFVHVSWASHVDLATGRPVERPEANWEDKAAMVAPGPPGGHGWHPMSFSPRTGYVYIPATELVYYWSPEAGYRFEPGRFNTGEDFVGLAATFEGLEDLNAMSCAPSRLIAWDPLGKREAWRVDFSTSVPGGVLSTAGDLVFQGNGSGKFAAYDARTGAALWSSDVGIGIMAPPVTYEVDGEQYVAVLAGMGGSLGGHFTRFEYENEGRILAWKLGGKASLPPVRMRPEPTVEAPEPTASPEVVSRGRAVYAEHCMRCHGNGARSSGLYPDLRHASRPIYEDWNDIVLGGTRAADGMASFADVIGAEEAQAVRAYVIERAHHQPGLLETAASWLARNACVPASWATD